MKRVLLIIFALIFVNIAFGMRQRPIFQRLKTFVDAQGYTIQQIQDATPLQIKNLLGLTDEEAEQYSKWVSGVKWLLIEDIKRGMREDFLDLVLTEVKKTYPNATGNIGPDGMDIQFNRGT